GGGGRAARGPCDLIAGGSGYALPLVKAAECTARDWAMMSLVRADDAEREGVAGFTQLVDLFCSSSLPVIFLPGVIHLSTVPARRKVNRVDLGTADKLAVAALAIAQGLESGIVVEMGSAFTACLVVERGAIVDGVGGSSGPVGWRAPGTWDGEAAYLHGTLTKGDLFRGGAAEVEQGRTLFRESLLRAVAGLRAVTPVERVVLSGRLLET